MKLKEAMRIYRRICKNNKDKCNECPLDVFGSLSCLQFMVDNTDKAEEVLEQWNREHPATTNRDKFFEVFGKQTYHDECCEICNTTFPCFNCDWWDEEYKEPVIK
jgi:hypothetical protein